MCDGTVSSVKRFLSLVEATKTVSVDLAETLMAVADLEDKAKDIDHKLAKLETDLSQAKKRMEKLSLEAALAANPVKNEGRWYVVVSQTLFKMLKSGHIMDVHDSDNEMISPASLSAGDLDALELATGASFDGGEDDDSDDDENRAYAHGYSEHTNSGVILPLLKLRSHAQQHLVQYSPGQLSQQQLQELPDLDDHPSDSLDVAYIDECLTNTTGLERHLQQLDEEENLDDSFNKDDVVSTKIENLQQDIQYEFDANESILAANHGAPQSAESDYDENEFENNEVALNFDRMDSSNGIAIEERHPLEDLLQDALDEIERLKSANYEFEKKNLQLSQDMALVLIDELVASFDSQNNNFEKQRKMLEADHATALSKLQTANNTLESELQMLRSSQQQMAAIRATLAEQKALDVLTMRVELMSEKERQLNDLKTQMDAERDRISCEFISEKLRLTGEINRLKFEIRNLTTHLEAEKTLTSDLRRDIAAAVIKKSGITKDAESQVHLEDESASLVREIAAVVGIEEVDNFHDAKPLIVSQYRKLRSQVDLQGLELIETRKQIFELKERTENLTKQNEILESMHSTTLQNLQSSHENSLKSLRLSYDHQIAILSKKLERLSDLDDLQSWHDLEKKFPVLFENYRAELQQKLDADQNAFMSKVKEYLDQEKFKLKNSKDQLLEAQLAQIRLQLDSQAKECEAKIGLQYSTAYKAAIQRLKEEYVKFQDDYRQKCFENSKHMEKMGEYENIIKNQEAYIMSLEETHIRAREQMKSDFEIVTRRIKEEAKAHYSAQLRNALDRMKRRYVESLRSQST
ncbi:hypothetical protein HDU83_006524 [Entophlyctis luteolus]|nr:hypothetical protein HDU83_006524 [Entophlyctis luteolus]